MCSSRHVKLKQVEYTVAQQIDCIVQNDLKADCQLGFKVWQQFSLSEGKRYFQKKTLPFYSIVLAIFSFLLLLQDTDQKQLGNERVYFSLQIPVCHQRNSGQEHKEETQRQEWKQRLCRMLVVTDLLPVTCSVSIFIQPRPTCLVMELSYTNQQSRKRSYRHSCRPIQWGHFLS